MVRKCCCYVVEAHVQAILALESNTCYTLSVKKRSKTDAKKSWCTPFPIFLSVMCIGGLGFEFEH